MVFKWIGHKFARKMINVPVSRKWKEYVAINVHRNIGMQTKMLIPNQLIVNVKNFNFIFTRKLFKIYYYCLACDCNRMGSVNDECDGKKGRCQCKPGVRGRKCDKCPTGTHLTHQGCVHNSLLKGSHQLHSCNNNHNRCRFGATCQKNGRCVCQFNCNTELEHHHHHHHSDTIIWYEIESIFMINFFFLICFHF